jgi:hypothetical protein
MYALGSKALLQSQLSGGRGQKLFTKLYCTLKYTYLFRKCNSLKIHISFLFIAVFFSYYFESKCAENRQSF